MSLLNDKEGITFDACQCYFVLERINHQTNLKLLPIVSDFQGVFKRIIFHLYVYVCVCYVYVDVQRLEDIKSPELELQVVVSHLIWILGTKVRSSAIVVSTLTFESSLQPPQIFSF